jgi:hypothetical protein
VIVVAQCAGGAAGCVVVRALNLRAAAIAVSVPPEVVP